MPSSLGAREWIALALLAVAAFISFTFLDAGARGDVIPRTPILPTPLATHTPEPTPTNTPQPPIQLPPPTGSWLIEYYIATDSTPSDQVYVDALDLEFAHGPFPDYPDDNWRLHASTTITLQPGTQAFTLVHDGPLRVTVDGQQVATAPDPSTGPRTLTVLFQHPGGPAQIRIEAQDRLGPFTLRWE